MKKGIKEDNTKPKLILHAMFSLNLEIRLVPYIMTFYLYEDTLSISMPRLKFRSSFLFDSANLIFIEEDMHTVIRL